MPYWLAWIVLSLLVSEIPRKMAVYTISLTLPLRVEALHSSLLNVVSHTCKPHASLHLTFIAFIIEIQLEIH